MLFRHFLDFNLAPLLDRAKQAGPARRLKQAIDAGYVTLKRKVLDPEEVAGRSDKRLNTAVAAAALMSMTIDKVDGTGKTMVCNRYNGPTHLRCLELGDLWTHAQRNLRCSELS